MTNNVIYMKIHNDKQRNLQFSIPSHTKHIQIAHNSPVVELLQKHTSPQLCFLFEQ